MNHRIRTITHGIALIVLAVCLICYKLNLFNLPAAFAGVSVWGLVISCIMLFIIIHSVIDLSFGGIFIPAAVICIIFDKPLGITALTPWTVLIVSVLLTSAFYMIFPRYFHHGHKYSHSHGKGDHYSEKYTVDSSEDVNGHVMHSFQFGSATKYVRNKELVSADLTVQFGELSVFFDGAEVPGKNVNINCHTSFGAMDIYIPADWRVENRVSVTLAHCDDRDLNRADVADPVHCVISGNVSFGELKIIRI